MAAEQMESAEDVAERLADTNMENYGGKEHRDKQAALAQKQPEWFGCGQEPGVEVWRINKFRVEKEDPAEFGTFYSGDSYIVLNAYNEENKDNLLFNVHFWLGENTTQDEAGTAAIKTVELDDLLGDLPVQYREVQGHETKGFNGLFPNGMNLLDGGHDTGFNHVAKEEYQPRLMHIKQVTTKTKKGRKKKKIQTRERPISLDSLNNNDVFILDCGEELYDFRPANASVWEKRAANDWVNQLKTDRLGKVKEHYIINWDDDTTDSAKFWEFFGEKPEDLPETAAFEAKKQAEEEALTNHVNVMFHVTDEDGVMSIEQIQEGVLDISILEQEDDDALIIDVGRVVFVWIGSTANREETRTAMTHAQQYLMDNNRPFWTPCERVFSGREPEHFRKCFGCEHVPANII